MSTASTISLEEFLARPDRADGQCEELIEGQVFVSPGPKVWHAAIIERLRRDLRPLENSGFVLSNDFSCILGHHSMPAPDLAAVSRARWNEAEDSQGWLEGSPELVVEVASPSNRRLQRKAAVYLEYGAEQVWLVNAKTRTVTVCTPAGNREARHDESIEFKGAQLLIDSIMGRPKA